jgi:hypothetical protein
MKVIIALFAVFLLLEVASAASLSQSEKLNSSEVQELYTRVKRAYECSELKFKQIKI